MVANFGLRTHELLHEEIGDIIAEIVSAKCYEEVASHFRRIIQNLHFWGFLYIFMT